MPNEVMPPDTDCPIFDTREKASGIFDFLYKNNYLFTVEQLEMGDCMLSDQCCIEIKRIGDNSNDLKESLFDGRLYTQSQQRREKFDLSIMIIEVANKHKIYDAHFTRKAFVSTEFSLEIDFNTHIYHTYDMKATVKLIYDIWEKIKKGKRYIPPSNRKKIPLTLREKRLRLLTGLLDVGEKKATELLTEFKDPASVFGWILETDEVREKIKGFDKKFFEKNYELIFGD